MKLSDSAKSRRTNDVIEFFGQSDIITRAVLISIAALLLVRYHVNKLTPTQRKVIYILATLTGGALIIVAAQYPALALIVGILLGALIVAISRI